MVLARMSRRPVSRETCARCHRRANYLINQSKRIRRASIPWLKSRRSALGLQNKVVHYSTRSRCDVLDVERVRRETWPARNMKQERRAPLLQ